MKIAPLTRCLSALFVTALASGCTIETSDDDNLGAGTQLFSDIPADPGGSAPSTVLNNLKPAAQFSKDASDGRRVRVNLLGLLDPMTSDPVVFEHGKTVFITEDDVLKGLKVTQSNAGNALASGIVFVVDNSSSMDDEADTIAERIIAFANLIKSNGLSARLGVVGVSGKINGAIDLGDPATVEAYLKRAGKSGTNRSVGFDGGNSAELDAKARAMNPNFGGGENGIHGILFAEAAFSFRSAAQRVFVNITDEPTQPASKTANNTQTLCQRWTPTTGTIHTVWSGSQSLEPGDGGAGNWTENVDENPAELSRCTPGGTVTTVKSDASDLDLTALPLTEALNNSALVEFATGDENASHTLKITVVNGNTADGETVFPNVTYAVEAR